MAFKLKKKPGNFTCTVDVHTPEGDGVIDWSFKAEFKVLTAADRDAGKGNIIEDGLISVSGVPAEEGINPDEIMALIKDRPDTRAALVKAYNDNITKKNQGLNFF